MGCLSPTQGSTVYVQEEVGGLYEPETLYGSKETMSSRHNRAGIFMNSQRLWQYAESGLNQTEKNLNTEKGRKTKKSHS